MESTARLTLKNIFWFFAGLFFLFAVFFNWFVFSAPKDFPANTFVTIDEGMSLSQIGATLKDGNYIKSELFFIILARAMNLEKKLQSGEYFFSQAEPMIKIALRLAGRDGSVKSVRVTVPEGSSSRDIALLLENFDNMDKALFIEKARATEGYLFPDTYFFSSAAAADKIISVMRKNFDKKISEIKDKIDGNKRELNEIMTMASLIEKEVCDCGDRRIVSGILWKRLDNGMPLQVDAVFPYIMGKNSYELTLDDLKTDSPYNTYLYKGLPPGPICNPGMDAILAALEPEDSPYWYYLSDKNGNTYFAKTFEEHKINKAKYLR